MAEGNLRSVDEIPLPWRTIFREYPCFNLVQSTVLDEAFKSDHSMVVSAPTGSGKTAIFELAIIRHLIRIRESSSTMNTKVVYISPIKALCNEKLIDWHKKFSDYGVKCITCTSDSDDADLKSLENHDLILSTPEKWDVLTRRWRSDTTLVSSVGLFLIDEVHLLNAGSRGSTLEVIVSRMKTAVESLKLNCGSRNIRFVALSATIPNIQDIAEWIGYGDTVKHFKFPDSVRPVLLNKIVFGYHFNPQTQSVFKFDMSLSYKLSGLITKYSEGQPTLIFCNTRKSVEMTANHLVSNLQIRLSQDQKELLMNISKEVDDVKLKKLVVHGIAIHHAGMMLDSRHKIEDLFRKGLIPVLVTTSTLALGVNLPAHLVIIKCTKQYSDGGYRDYDEVSIFQMIGRAGRSQFDKSATALILTSDQDKSKYEQMLSCRQLIESSLHRNLIEHLNAEVALGTITDLDVALKWLSSTFLYVRAKKAPEKYNLPYGLSKEKTDRKLLEMCQLELNKLVKSGMIKMSQDIEVSPTVVGQIMARYYIAYETMKLFTEVTGTEIMIQILAIISKCSEFSGIYLRSSDKKCLNLLNKNTKSESNRFPLSGRIKTVDMKVNVLIQAVLGNLDIHDQSVLCDSSKVLRNCERLAKCLIEYLETRDNCYCAMFNAITLAKCFKVKLWENSPYVSKQLTGVGPVMSRLLAKANLTTFRLIADANPRHIELIVNRRAPFGTTVVEEASHLPQYNLLLQKKNNVLELSVILANPEDVQEKSTICLDSMMILLVGDSNNSILLYEKYSHAYMLDNPNIKKSVILVDENVQFVRGSFISENWVGIDCHSSWQSNKPTVESQIEQPKKNSTKQVKQSFMDIYLNTVEKVINKKKNAEKNTSIVQQKAQVSQDLQQVTNPSYTTLPNTEKNPANQGQSKVELKNNKVENLESTNKTEIEQQRDFPPISNKVSNGNGKGITNNDVTQTKTPINLSGKFDQQYQNTVPIMNDSTKICEIEKLAGQPKILSHFIVNDEGNNESQENLLELIREMRDSEVFENENAFEKSSILNETRQFDKKHAENGDENQNKFDSDHENKGKMTNPDSTAEMRAAFHTDNMSKRFKEIEQTPRNLLEQKSIKWKSPLIDSPAAKKSPINRFYFRQGHYHNGHTQEYNEQSIVEDRSYSSRNSTLDSTEKRVLSSPEYPPKLNAKKRKYQFPLSDQETANDTLNVSESFSKDLEQICDLESFGLSKRRRDSVGKYYMELMNSSKKTSPARSVTCAKPSATITHNSLQHSQDLFSQDAFLSPRPVANQTKKVTVQECPENPTWNSSSQNNLNSSSAIKTFTGVGYTCPNLSVEFDNRAESPPAKTKTGRYSCFDTYCHSNPKNFNPYLISEPSPERYMTLPHLCRTPMPQLSHPHPCCPHNTMSFPHHLPYMDTHPVWPANMNRLEGPTYPYSQPQYRQMFNAIPESYLDESIQQLNQSQPNFTARNHYEFDNYQMPRTQRVASLNPYLYHHQPMGMGQNLILPTSNKENHNLQYSNQQGINNETMQNLSTDNYRHYHVPSRSVSQVFGRCNKPRLPSATSVSMGTQSNRQKCNEMDSFKRLRDHNSFEERLNNVIIMPPNSCANYGGEQPDHLENSFQANNGRMNSNSAYFGANNGNKQ